MPKQTWKRGIAEKVDRNQAIVDLYNLDSKKWYQKRLADLFDMPKQNVYRVIKRNQ